MKRIIDMCKLRDPMNYYGVKLRLRGKGSGFKEGPKNRESNDDLHLCVSSQFMEYNNYEMHTLFPFYQENITMAYEVFIFACKSIENLLHKVYKDYEVFQTNKKLSPNGRLNIKKLENNPAILMSQMETFEPHHA
jgi:hypothetical protein